MRARAHSRFIVNSNLIATGNFNLQNLLLAHVRKSNSVCVCVEARIACCGFLLQFGHQFRFRFKTNGKRFRDVHIVCVCEWVYVKPCGVFYFGFTTLLSAFPIYIGVRKFITDLLIIKTVRASDLKITKIFAAGNSFCKLNLTLLFLVIFGVYIGEIFHYCLFSIDF